VRAFLDAILSFIGGASLSDEEFAALTISVEFYGYNKATYEALLAVLDGRENVSTQKTRLYSFFIAKGIDVGTTPSNAKTNMWMGSVLE
jgi:hypothetical protein